MGAEGLKLVPPSHVQWRAQSSGGYTRVIVHDIAVCNDHFADEHACHVLILSRPYRCRKVGVQQGRLSQTITTSKLGGLRQGVERLKEQNHGSE